jgi:hypothetical protein
MPVCRSLYRPLAFGLASLLCAASANARLGGDEASVSSDAQALATLPVRQATTAYTRYDLVVGRVTIHEYVGLAGQVFAITFGGGNTPRLDVLLGSFVDTFNAAEQHDHRSASVNTPTLKGGMQGRPGLISGRFWLPAMVPAGVNPEALP